MRGIRDLCGDPRCHQNLSDDVKERKRIKCREAILKRYADGWEPVCGRAKKYRYCSTVAGNISVDGTWELIVAKYLDRLGVNWSRNKIRFPYVNLKGTKSTYQPDFFVSDWNTFIEVKGYETALDRCKWDQFQHPLLIWKEQKVKEIQKENELIGD